MRHKKEQKVSFTKYFCDLKFCQGQLLAKLSPRVNRKLQLWKIMANFTNLINITQSRSHLKNKNKNNNNNNNNNMSTFLNMSPLFYKWNFRNTSTTFFRSTLLEGAARRGAVLWLQKIIVREKEKKKEQKNTSTSFATQTPPALHWRARSGSLAASAPGPPKPPCAGLDLRPPPWGFHWVKWWERNDPKSRLAILIFSFLPDKLRFGKNSHLCQLSSGIFWKIHWPPPITCDYLQPERYTRRAWDFEEEQPGARNCLRKEEKAKAIFPKDINLGVLKSTVSVWEHGRRWGVRNPAGSGGGRLGVFYSRFYSPVLIVQLL